MDYTFQRICKIYNDLTAVQCRFLTLLTKYTETKHCLSAHSEHARHCNWRNFAYSTAHITREQNTAPAIQYTLTISIVTALGQVVTKLWHTKMEHSLLQNAGNTNKLTEQMSTHSLYYNNHRSTVAIHFLLLHMLLQASCHTGIISIATHLADCHIIPPPISVPNETCAHYFLHISNSRRSTGMLWHSNLKAGTTPVRQHIFLHILQFYCF